LVGWAYFAIMRWSLGRLAPGSKAVGPLVGFALLRIALFAAGVVGAFYCDVWALAGYLFGFLVARTVCVARVRGELAKPGLDARSAIR